VLTQRRLIAPQQDVLTRPPRGPEFPFSYRELNVMADLQANLSIDLLLRLGAAARAPPSGYRPAALRLASVLALPAAEVLKLEGADDFRAAIALVRPSAFRLFHF
jgi:hypothetical protein